jgi:UDPglucose--hexose-1-phosphate uridylyltransferase
LGELRKDYVLDRWVIVASERGARPHQFMHEEKVVAPELDFFAPGNESMTPVELDRVGDDSGWRIRVFNNKFAAARLEGQIELKTDNEFFTYSANYGEHEVIVETPDSLRQLWDFSDSELLEVYEMYNKRIGFVKLMDGIKYVNVFKNHKKDAGTSIVHSHSQLVGLNHVPQFVKDKVEATKKYDGCPYCKIVEIEKKSDRHCFENDDFVAFTPYASRFPFEIWVFPKQHLRLMSELNLKGLSEIMGKILRKLKEIDAAFNYVVHYSPDNEDLHFHIEVLPRLSKWAGFEFSGTIINKQPPEEAAKFYRGEI